MGLFNSNKYKVELLCSNCNQKQAASISKGTTIQDYLRDAECNNCGLKKLIFESAVEIKFSELFKDIKG